MFQTFGNAVCNASGCCFGNSNTLAVLSLLGVVAVLVGWLVVLPIVLDALMMGAISFAAENPFVLIPAIVAGEIIADESSGGLVAEMEGIGYNFVTEERLLDHFMDHKDEYGFETTEEYLDAANRLISDGEGVETFVRSNGDALFYDSSINDLAVLTKDGVIRTFFKPVEGRNYWLEQIGRLPE